MEEQGELLLADKFRHRIDGGKVACSQGGKRINIIFARAVVFGRDDISSHINDNDTVNTQLYQLIRKNPIDLLKLLLTDNSVIHAFSLILVMNRFTGSA